MSLLFLFLRQSFACRSSLREGLCLQYGAWQLRFRHVWKAKSRLGCSENHRGGSGWQSCFDFEMFHARSCYCYMCPLTCSWNERVVFQASRVCHASASSGDSVTVYCDYEYESATSDYDYDHAQTTDDRYCNSCLLLPLLLPLLVVAELTRADAPTAAPTRVHQS